MRTIGSGPKGFPHIASQMLNRPLAIDPYKAEVLICALQQRLGLLTMDTLDGLTLDAKAMIDRAALARDAVRERNGSRTYHVDGDIAVIPIDGTLVHKFGYLDPTSGMTGYDGLHRKLSDAMRDPDVLGIWLDIDSPGGSVAGLMEFARELAGSTASEGGKPIFAWIGETACSAAYAIASVCDRIYAPAGSVTGSIGCVMVHTSVADAVAAQGAQVTVFRSGARKMRGNLYENLDEAAVAKFQETVERAALEFAGLVSVARRISVKNILALEGDWFLAEEALERRLIDGVMAEREAWARLEEECDRIKRKRRSGR